MALGLASPWFSWPEVFKGPASTLDQFLMGSEDLIVLGQSLRATQHAIDLGTLAHLRRLGQRTNLFHFEQDAVVRLLAQSLSIPLGLVTVGSSPNTWMPATSCELLL